MKHNISYDELVKLLIASGFYDYVILNNIQFSRNPSAVVRESANFIRVPKAFSIKPKYSVIDNYNKHTATKYDKIKNPNPTDV